MQEPLPPALSTLAGELYLRHAEAVVSRLQREFHWVHEDDIAEAAVEAILSAARDSRDFNPDRGSFDTYLLLQARDHVRTRLRSEKRRKERESKKAAMDVTPALSPAPSNVDEDDAPDPSLVQELLAALTHTESERAALRLWMQGIDSPADIALRLGYGSDEAAVRRAATLMARLRQRIHREKLKRQGSNDEDAS